MNKIKKPFAKNNGNGNVEVNKNVWHIVSKAVPMVLGILIALGILWGRLKGIVVNNTNVSKIPAMELKIASVDKRVLMAEKKVEPIKNMQNDITDLKIGVGEINGKLDVLIMKIIK